MADYSEAKVQYDREDRERRQGMSERDLDRPRQQTVGGQLTHIQDQVGRMDELLKVLEERLSPILAPEVDGEKSVGENDSSPLRLQSDLAETLEAHGDRIARHSRRVERMINRINL